MLFACRSADSARSGNWILIRIPILRRPRICSRIWVRLWVRSERTEGRIWAGLGRFIISTSIRTRRTCNYCQHPAAFAYLAAQLAPATPTACLFCKILQKTNLGPGGPREPPGGVLRAGPESIGSDDKWGPFGTPKGASRPVLRESKWGRPRVASATANWAGPERAKDVLKRRPVAQLAEPREPRPVG